MQMTLYGKKRHLSPPWKRAPLLLLLFCSLASFGQSIRLSVQGAPLEDVFRQIESQTDYRFVYAREELKEALPVTLSVSGRNLKKILDRVFANQPLSFSLHKKYITVHRREPLNASPAPAAIEVSGRVTSETGEPLAAASVLVKGSVLATTTDGEGHFLLHNLPPASTLLVSSVGYVPREVPLNGRSLVHITLTLSVGTLDETVVIAYGTTTRRLATGSIGKITSGQIEKQPVSNPLAALSGRVPGLVVTQASGLPGASFKVQVRGRNSLQQGSEPLFIIDGVPFAPNNNPINNLTSIVAPGPAEGLSPFHLLNPADIESIEVLKDADATAIYGSRGANGVVLITTKKGRAGKTRLEAQVYHSASRVTRSPRMLHTEAYLKMRREAFANDGLTPTVNNAPDLLLWDSTRYTDFRKLLTGGTAHATDAQVTLSGGSALTQFLLGGSYHHQTTVFPGDMQDRRASAHVSVTQTSANQKFTAAFTASYATDENNLVGVPLPESISLPPNTPSLYDSAGRLNWREGGVSFENPLAYLLRTYRAQTNNLISNATFGYELLPGLQLKASGGYNRVDVQEKSLTPKASLNPSVNPTGLAGWGSNAFTSYLVEPQLSYATPVGKGKLSTLLGATWQQTLNEGTSIRASGYTDDALLESLQGAASLTATSRYTRYRYEALFGRLQYNRQDRYLLSVSGRRDGSSRFGPGRQFATFGAVGAGWVFSEEAFVKKHLPFLSFGKLRGSYGTTGNDQIGDYKYLDAWTPTPYPYASTPGLFPSYLFNADYRWEENRKLEGALELGFLKNRVVLSAAHYRNRSSNQLILYILPAQTGFTTLLRNFGALVQNTGWEGTLTTHNIVRPHLRWETSLNITVPRNRLVSFPGLASSSYASIYEEGTSISLLKGYEFRGVDPATGSYTFLDVNKDGVLSQPKDFRTIGHLDPSFYGGVASSVQYKKLGLEVLFEFRKQLGANFRSTFRTRPPGSMFNQPEAVLDRWQRPGDAAAFGRFTSGTATPAYAGIRNLTYSDAVYSDASFLRLKNLSLNCGLPEGLLRKMGAQSSRVFLRGQNLLTVTPFQGADPETQNFFGLPPLKTLAAGVQFTF